MTRKCAVILNQYTVSKVKVDNPLCIKLCAEHIFSLQGPIITQRVSVGGECEVTLKQ